MIRLKRLVPALVLATTFLILGSTEDRAASADVLNCPQQSGTVRVWDRERNACGWLSVSNPDWRRIGSPAWDNRIDDFGNDDFGQGRDMCLYSGYQYSGNSVLLPVGHRVVWNNTVSSNAWRLGGCF
jgi:hypothetical protein